MNVSFDLDYLCASSRLRLSAKEKNRLSPQLERIVDWIGELEKVVPFEIDLTFHQSLSRLGTLREDKADSSFSNRQALVNSQESKEGYFSVPKVIKSK